MNDLDIPKIFEFAKEVTLEAGKIVQRGFEDEKAVQTKQFAWDLVTDYDREVEEFVIGRLAKEFPEHKFIAEERSEKSPIPELTDAPTWLIDPIDGTVNFVHALPLTCISVGLSICKQLVLGIIYNPSNSELYTAIKGEGAFLNGKPIRTSKVTDLEHSLLALDTSAIRYGLKNRDIKMSRMKALTDVAQGVRNIGSAALTLAYIARGVIDCFHMDHLKPWDVAAGALIVREAGGKVLDTRGGVYDVMKPNTVAAATEALAQQITKMIVDTDLKTQRERLQRTP